MRNYITKAATVSLIAMLTSNAFAQSTYTVQEIALPPGSKDTITEVTKINSAGNVLALSRVKFAEHPFLWSNGNYTSLNAPALYSGQSAIDINKNGNVVGYAQNNKTGDFAPVTWTNGNAQLLATQVSGLDSSDIELNAINDNSQMVGNYSDDVAGYDRGFIINSGDLAKDIKAPSNYGNFIPMSINNSGAIGGTFLIPNDNGGPDSGSFFVKSGSTTVLAPTPSLGDSPTAFAISAANTLVGTIDTDTSTYGAVVTGKTIWTVPSLGGQGSAVYGINDSDEIVGSAELAASINGTKTHAIFISNHVVQDLNSLIPSDSAVVLEEALDINNCGVIVANGIRSELHRGYVLTPSVPKPGCGPVVPTPPTTGEPPTPNVPGTPTPPSPTTPSDPTVGETDPTNPNPPASTLGYSINLTGKGLQGKKAMLNISVAGDTSTISGDNSCLLSLIGITTLNSEQKSQTLLGTFPASALHNGKLSLTVKDIPAYRSKKTPSRKKKFVAGTLALIQAELSCTSKLTASSTQIIAPAPRKAKKVVSVSRWFGIVAKKLAWR